MMDIERLKVEFHEQMIDIYRVAKAEAGYVASRFLSMVNEDSTGGVQTAKYLIHLEPPSDGYTALYLKGRLDLTVEAVVLGNAKWHPLFSGSDLETCRKRLAAYHYAGLNTSLL